MNHPDRFADRPFRDDHRPTGDAGGRHLVLIRHGQTASSLAGRLASSADPALTPCGEEQAAAIAKALGGHRFGLVLSSPFQRALRTAALAGYREQTIVDEDLTEFDYGAYDGLTLAEINERREAPWDIWRDGAPDGDSAESARVRAGRIIDRALGAMSAKDDVVLFAHGHILRAIAAAWLDLRPIDAQIFAVETATVGVLGFEHRRPVILRWNTPPGMLRFPLGDLVGI